jgi:hypothetical protein
MHEIKEPIRNRLWESESQDTNKAIWTHFEQPQIRSKTNENLSAFWALIYELKIPIKN